MIGKWIARCVISNRPTERDNFIWNMIGSGIYALSTMVLSLFVIKIVGAEQGGIFSIALTLSQMLVYIAYFETRTFEITDSEDKYLFSQYHAVKIVLCFAMLLVSAGYAFARDYDFTKRCIILLVCLSRLVDGYADVYEAQFQKDGRLDLAGKSLAYRTVLFVVSLLLSLWITKGLISALIVADIVAIAGVFLFDMCVMSGMSKITCSWEGKKIKEIIKGCFPLFIGVFCWTYILSASRIAIDGSMSSEYQSYYQIIFMPVSVINLFAGFVIRPMLPKLADDYSSQRHSAFLKAIGCVMICIVGITAICMAGAWILGIPVLSILSGCDLSCYKNTLVFLIFAGGFNAASYTLYYVLTIMRSNKYILTGYITSAVLAFCISKPMVVRWGIWGAAGSYFIAVSALFLLFLVFIYKELMRIKK